MKLFYVLIILFFFNNCSFDDKTGIWKNDNSIENKDDSPFKDFKTISNSKEIFGKVISLDKNHIFRLSKPMKNKNWKEINYNNSNNFQNIQYNNNKQLIFQSKKLTKHKVGELLFDKDNLILSDKKGNLIIYSVNENKIISKFNFYKNKYKNLKKNLNLIIEKDIIYVSDNIGYLYAYNYNSNSIIWAKDFKIPFKSNLKIFNNMIIAANHKNNIFFFNKKNGEIIKSIPTEETIVTNQFQNRFSINGNSLFFLNSFGSFYSINLNLKKVDWFINLNQTTDLTTSNLFYGEQIVSFKNRAVVASNQSTYLIDAQTGSIVKNNNFLSNLKPIINNEYVFYLTKNDFLIASDLKTGNILYSYNIKKKIAEFLGTKKKIQFNSFVLSNNKILIFLNKSFIAQVNINGELEEVYKLASKIKTKPIFINGSILYLDFKNKLKILD